MLNPACPTTPVATRLRPGATVSTSRNAIAAILNPSDVLLDLDVPTKKRALEDISRFVGARHGLVDDEVYASLVEREEIGSTALGQGFAIPHARVPGLSRAIAAFVRTEIPIPFDAPDGKPVSDMLVILVPQHATDAHLMLLAQAAEMFCDVSFRERLRASVDAAEVHATFAQWRPTLSDFRYEDLMESVTQWLCPRQIELDVDLPNRWEALRAVSAMIERSQGLSAPPVFRALWRREMAGSTAVGNGLAIPHARIAGIAEPVTVYVRTKGSVELCGAGWQAGVGALRHSRSRRRAPAPSTCNCWRWWRKRFRIAISALAWPRHRPRRTSGPRFRNGSAKGN